MSLIGTIKYLTIGNSTYEIYNTDTKVTQSAAQPENYTYWRPMIIGSSSASSQTTSPSTVTNTTYTFSSLMVQPSSGTIRFGIASLYNENYTVSLSADTLTTNRTILIPDSDGTLALTTDIVDTKVTQTATTTNSTYELLFSETADNTTRTEGARKTSTLTYNPYTKALLTGGTINNYNLAAACEKEVDSSINNGSTSINLPTTAAVVSFVEGKGYTALPAITAADNGKVVSVVDGAYSLVTLTNANGGRF